MSPIYRIHPGIGIARVGDSPHKFYLAPESIGALPIDCHEDGNPKLDSNGNEQPTQEFKDGKGCIKRQAARFQVYVYDDQSPDGRPLKVGDTVHGIDSSGVLLDIEWSVYLANKKACWYEFHELQGEHGYAAGDPTQPLRNADVKGAARQSLIIDPGPQTVNNLSRRTAEFAKGKNPAQGQTFPPPLRPHSIETLGEIRTDDNNRLLVLGGYGRSGCYKTSFGQPAIESYANNDGWFDDVSDGPVTAILSYYDAEDQETRYIQVHDSAWVIVGQPGYAPQIVNMITVDDVLYDLSIRKFAFNPYMYGTEPFDSQTDVPASQLAEWRQAQKRWNPDYYPGFWSEIWPILTRPYYAQYTTDFLGISHDAHEIGLSGDFDLSKVSVPPTNGDDPYLGMRRFIYAVLRQPGHENQYQSPVADPTVLSYLKVLMPLLCGDNPLTNTLPSKFLVLTDAQLFVLRQWAEGKFINEQMEGIATITTTPPHQGVSALDRGALSNLLGGAFCPGGEVGWIIRNPDIYLSPYRIRWNPAFLPTSGSGRIAGNPEFYPPQLSLTEDPVGLQPGDLTKRNAVPWQADFNECSTQPIEISYPEWCVLYDPAGKPIQKKINQTLWWPTHRPMQVFQQNKTSGKYVQVEWARGIPQTPVGDLKMVTAWADLGFVVQQNDPKIPTFIEILARDQTPPVDSE